jgi:putative FmdB family regulatory protein
MPSYEFECLKCGHRFELQQTFADHDKHKGEKCPKCGSQKVQQVITPAFVQTSKKS